MIQISLYMGHHRPASKTKRHLNGVSLAGQRWPNMECWPGSFVVFQGIRTSIAKKTYNIVIFQGGGDALSPPQDPPMVIVVNDNHFMVYSVKGPIAVNQSYGHS